jgi:hypothetical protein
MQGRRACALPTAILLQEKTREKTFNASLDLAFLDAKQTYQVLSDQMYQRKT